MTLARLKHLEGEVYPTEIMINVLHAQTIAKMSFFKIVDMFCVLSHARL